MSVSIKMVNGKKMYRARGTDPDTGKRVDSLHHLKKDADKFDRALAERAQARKLEKRGINTTLPKYTVSAKNRFCLIAQDYIDQSRVGRDGKRPLELNTLANYQTFVDRFFDDAFGDLTVEEMSRQDVRASITRMRELTPSTDMARRVFRFAKAVMKWAVESLELREASPFNGLDIEAEKTDKHRVPKTHTNEEIARMVAVAYKKYTSPNGTTRKAWYDYFPIFMLLATTGMRSSECFALTWDSFNEDMSIARIDKRVMRYVKGVTKDNRIGPPKSSYSYRDVPIPVQVSDLLSARREAATAPWVFPDDAGGPKGYRAVHEWMWKPLLKDSGVRPLGMHALRHYAASLVIQEKGILAVRDLLGHHSAAFTVKTYGGFVDDKAAMFKDIGNMFGGRLSGALAAVDPEPGMSGEIAGEKVGN